MIKTFKAVRAAFWAAHPEFKNEYRTKKRQNEYRADIRCAFVDYVDHLQRCGEISEKISQNVTL